jgi:hypothetical protein
MYHKQNPALSIDSASKKLSIPSEERGVQSPRGMPLDLVDESEKVQKWIQNANMGIDIARASLEEAAKLALNVQKITQATVGDALRTGQADLTQMGKDTQEEKERVLLLESEREGGGFEETAIPVEDIVKLHERAVQVQAAVEESRRALLLAETQPLAESFETMVSVKEHVVDLALYIEQTLQEPKQGLDTRERGGVGADHILEGEGAAVDAASLNKVDGLKPNRKGCASSSDPIEFNDVQVTLTAEEILKHGEDILLADPISLDKIDGLPDRDHQGGVEEHFTTVRLA